MSGILLNDLHHRLETASQKLARHFKALRDQARSSGRSKAEDTRDQNAGFIALTWDSKYVALISLVTGLMGFAASATYFATFGINVLRYAELSNFVVYGVFGLSAIILSSVSFIVIALAAYGLILGLIAATSALSGSAFFIAAQSIFRTFQGIGLVLSLIDSLSRYVRLQVLSQRRTIHPAADWRYVRRPVTRFLNRYRERAGRFNVSSMSNLGAALQSTRLFVRCMALTAAIVGFKLARQWTWAISAVVIFFLSTVVLSSHLASSSIDCFVERSRLNQLTIGSDIYRNYAQVRYRDAKGLSDEGREPCDQARLAQRPMNPIKAKDASPWQSLNAGIAHLLEPRMAVVRVREVGWLGDLVVLGRIGNHTAFYDAVLGAPMVTPSSQVLSIHYIEKTPWQPAAPKPEPDKDAALVALEERLEQTERLLLSDVEAVREVLEGTSQRSEALIRSMVSHVITVLAGRKSSWSLDQDSVERIAAALSALHSEETAKNRAELNRLVSAIAAQNGPTSALSADDMAFLIESWESYRAVADTSIRSNRAAIDQLTAALEALRSTTPPRQSDGFDTASRTLERIAKRLAIVDDAAGCSADAKLASVFFPDAGQVAANGRLAVQVYERGDRSSAQAARRTVLEKLPALLSGRLAQSDSDHVLVLQGYASPDGDPIQNYTLSKQRADAVSRYLVSQGAKSRDAIRVLGNGEYFDWGGDYASSFGRRVDVYLCSPQAELVEENQNDLSPATPESAG